MFNLDGEVLSRAEFHDALIRLGLGISKEKCNTIFDRVDVAGDGAIDVREFIAFVNGATTTVRSNSVAEHQCCLTIESCVRTCRPARFPLSVE